LALGIQADHLRVGTGGLEIPVARLLVEMEVLEILADRLLVETEVLEILAAAVPETGIQVRLVLPKHLQAMCVVYREPEIQADFAELDTLLG
jgi:hypothetical protein